MLLRFCLAACCCFLAACATPDFDRALQNPDWEIAGKIGIQQAGERPVSTIFRWRQKGDTYAIFLFNSLGQIQLTLEGNKRISRAMQPDGQSATAKSPEALLEKLTGWSFPVQAVKYWLNGETRGQETDITRNEQGLPTAFQSQQWLVNLGYDKTAEGSRQPHKLKLDQDNIHITIVIKEHARSIP